MLAGATAALALAAIAVHRLPVPYVVAAAAGPAEPVRRRRGGASAPSAADELPLLLDLLATATAAGMSGPAAFGAAATALRGPLGSSLRAVAAATTLGGRFAEVLHATSAHLALPDLSRAATILGRSGSLGVPVSVALRDLAAEHRRARRRAAEQRARTAPVRMLFPLVFLVLPAFLLLSVVPMLLATLGSLS